MIDKPSVLFIVPPGPRKLYRGMICTFISKANYIWQPFDFITLSAHVPPEYDVRLLDSNIEGLDVRACLKKIKLIDLKAAVVSISSIAFQNDTEFVKRLREAFPALKILVFGDVLLERYFWQKVQGCGVDLILNPMDVDLGDYIKTGRTSSRNIVLARERRGEDERVKPDKPKKVSIGIPRHKPFIHKYYRMPFMRSFIYTTVSTQFSCPYRCHYCSCAKAPVTYRGHEEVVKELDSVKGLGVREIYFGDPSFGYPKDNAKRLLESMIERKYGFKWFCYFNPALGDEDTLRLMRSAGCHTVIIGVEDADFDLLNAEFERKLSADKLSGFVNDCRKLGIRVCGDFIIGLNDKEEAYENLVKLALNLGLDFASFNIYSPLMGSVVREKMVREGKITPDAVGFDPGGEAGSPDARLIELRNRAARRFYFRPSYLAGRVLSLSGPKEFFIQFAEMIELFKQIFTQRRRYAK